MKNLYTRVKKNESEIIHIMSSLFVETNTIVASFHVDTSNIVLSLSETSTMFDVTQTMSCHHVVVKNATTFKEKMPAMRRCTVL